jgi:hypothetical protein
MNTTFDTRIFDYNILLDRKILDMNAFNENQVITRVLGL